MSETSILVVNFTKNYGESCKRVNEYPFNLDKNLKPSLTVFLFRKRLEALEAILQEHNKDWLLTFVVKCKKLSSEAS